jgi:hypothetical protein
VHLERLFSRAPSATPVVLLAPSNAEKIRNPKGRTAFLSLAGDKTRSNHYMRAEQPNEAYSIGYGSARTHVYD